MRDSGIPELPDQGSLDWFAGLAREALCRLVSERDNESADVKQEHLDHFMQVLAAEAAGDAGAMLDKMVALHLDPNLVACTYTPAAAHVLGDKWLADELSFVDVTVRTERLQGLVRRVDAMLDEPVRQNGLSALVLVAEAEQHTLGALVLALRLRLAGFSVVVRVAPVAAELSVLLAANRFDLALVSVGCTAALGSSVGLVRTMRLMSRGEMRIYVGGAIPVSDEVLLSETGADRVLRDVSSLLSDYESGRPGDGVDRQGKTSQGSFEKALGKGGEVDT